MTGDNWLVDMMHRTAARVSGRGADALTALAYLAGGVLLYLFDLYRLVAFADPFSAWHIILLVAVCAAVTQRRRHPLIALLLACVPVAIDGVLGPSLPVWLAFGDLLYAATLYGPRRAGVVVLRSSIVLTGMVAAARLEMTASRRCMKRSRSFCGAPELARCLRRWPSFDRSGGAGRGRRRRRHRPAGCRSGGSPPRCWTEARPGGAISGRASPRDRVDRTGQSARTHAVSGAGIPAVERHRSGAWPLGYTPSAHPVGGSADGTSGYADCGTQAWDKLVGRRSDGGEECPHSFHEQRGRFRVVRIERGVGEEVLVAGIDEQLGG